MSTIAYLRALQATIASALDDIERVYSENGVQFPSADVPHYQNNPPADQANTNAAEKLANSTAVVKASENVVAACGQLAIAVNRPFFTLTEGATAFHFTACLQFLEQSNAVEILRAAGPDGLHVNELAKKIDEIRASSGPVAKPLEPSQLSHILRLLAAHHWVREVRPDVFANNRISSYIDSGKTPEQLREDPLQKYDGSNGIATLIPIMTNDTFLSMSYFSEFLLAPRPESPYKALYNYAHKTEDTPYAVLERPEYALRLKQLSHGMSAGAPQEGNGRVASTSSFPWDKLPKDALVVDVGGGIGSVSVRIALAHSNPRFIVQDRAKTVALGPAFFKQHKAALFDSGRVRYQAHDFMEPQPERAPAVFILSRIMHNCDDERGKKILARLREAAGPDTKVLICDQILPLACQDPSETVDGPLAPADSPLLPNLGKAYAVGYHFDMAMFSMFNGKERTMREFAELAAATGWKIAHVERAEGSVWAYTTLAAV